MNLNEPVSNRQFAKMVGQSEGAVRKAVGRSSIVEGLTADKKIIPIIAAREWGKDILPEFQPEGYSKPKAVTKNKPIVKQSPKPAPAKKNKSIVDDEPRTAENFFKMIMDEKLPSIKKKDIDNEPDDVDFENDDDEGEISERVGKPEAERRTAILKAKILQLAYNEKKALLIPREKISSVLFAYGQETRVMFESLSTRVIDRIMACDDRNDGKRILDEEIHNILNMLSDIPNRNL